MLSYIHIYIDIHLIPIMMIGTEPFGGSRGRLAFMAPVDSDHSFACDLDGGFRAGRNGTALFGDTWAV